VVVDDEDVVQVLFIDAADGSEIGRSELFVDQLPDSFATSTTVDLNGTTWLVERADPPDATQFRAAGQLVLMLRRTDLMPPGDILYSLPTICDVLPSAAPAELGADLFEVHEDDWRQAEMVSADLRDVVDAELRAIRAIHQDHARRDAAGHLTGFEAIHVRTRPARPLPTPLPRQRMLSLLPPADCQYAGVTFTGSAGAVAGSFAVAVGPVSLYGLADGDAVHVLCVRADPTPATELPPDLIRGLGQIMQEFDVSIVDWPRCSIIEPATLRDYLSAAC
jgi:hypothetical protein